jgi:hypothetical protein
MMTTAVSNLTPRLHILSRSMLSVCGGILAIFFAMQIGGSALAVSPHETPSYTLKIFDYEAVIFYRPDITYDGTSTGVSIDQRSQTGTNPSPAEIQRRADKAQEAELVYHPGWTGSFAKIPKAEPVPLSIFISLQRMPFVDEINPKILAEIERASDDANKNHFDADGYRLVSYLVPNLVMQRSRYSRPDGRPFYLLRREESRIEPKYAYSGTFLYGKNARVIYYFRNVSKEHWVEVDKAVHEFVAAVLTRPPNQP